MIIEFIKSIDGPIFLLVYIVFSVIVILITSRIANRDGTQYLQVPEPTKFSPQSLSLLSLGIKGAIRLAIFSLWKSKKIEIKPLRKGNKIGISSNSINSSGENELEDFILNKIVKGNKYEDLFTNGSISEAATLLTDHYQKLLEMQLITSTIGIARLKWITLVAALILVVFGSYLR